MVLRLRLLAARGGRPLRARALGQLQPAARRLPLYPFPFLKGMSVFKYTSSWVKVTRMAKSQVSGIPEAQVTASYESDTKVGDLRPGLWWWWWWGWWGGGWGGGGWGAHSARHCARR